MATVNQIIGGNFIDITGSPLANGTVTFVLSSDEQVNSDTQLCANSTITVQLDGTGNVPNSPTASLWPNDVITPAASFYLITAYSSSGQRVWGPINAPILSTPSPFDLGALIP